MDKQGRLHIAYPHTGPLFIFNHATKFHSSMSQSRANDLFHVLKREVVEKQRHAVAIVTDNGPDYDMKSMMNMLYFGRLW